MQAVKKTPLPKRGRAFSASTVALLRAFHRKEMVGTVRDHSSVISKAAHETSHMQLRIRRDQVKVCNCRHNTYKAPVMFKLGIQISISSKPAMHGGVKLWMCTDERDHARSAFLFVVLYCLQYTEIPVEGCSAHADLTSMAVIHILVIGLFHEHIHAWVYCG